MMEAMFVLCDIMRYLDVETGWLVLTVGDHTKSWKAIWQTNLGRQFSWGRSLPRTQIPIYFRNHDVWVDCPKLALTHKNAMWMMPLKSQLWIDLGVDLYLCEDCEELQPLNKADYQLLVQALKKYGVRHLTVEPATAEVDDCLLHHSTFEENFWK